MSISPTAIAPTHAETDALLAPFMVERMAGTDPRWLALLAKERRRWRNRLLKRRLLSWLPGMGRTQAYVRDSYEATWDARPWPVTHAPPGSDRKPTAAQWNDEGLIVRRGALPRLHLAAMARVIDVLRPRRVLEVGAGTGRNLFVLATRFPLIDFTGIELTARGVAQARALQSETSLPALVADYCPWPDPDRESFRRISFDQGDATALPYADGAFDLVFTRQALEQMNMVRAPALREIARVSGSHTLHGEPFADFNRDPLRSSYVAAKDYFSLPIDGLREFGLAPVMTVDAFPMNIRLGVGVVLTEKAR